MTEPTSCRACADAEANPLTGSYRSNCTECQARALAHSPAYHDAKASGRMLPEYVTALHSLIAEGADDEAPTCAQRDALHARVKAWARRIEDQKQV